MSAMASANHLRLDDLLNRLFRRRSKETSKFGGEFAIDWWIPRKKGQWRVKCFYLMTSSTCRCLQFMITDLNSHSLLTKMLQNKWKFAVLVSHVLHPVTVFWQLCWQCHNFVTSLWRCHELCEHILTTLWRFWSNWRFDEYATIQILKYVTKLP